MSNAAPFLTSRRDEHKFMSFVYVGLHREGRFDDVMPRQLSILTSTFFDTLIARLPPWAIDSRVCHGANNIALATALRYLDLAAGFVTRAKC